ncbi:MAG TPA: mycofactocin radical SAM maturase [Acidimicrobiales bacterium]|nr:mycofactocin radical SAM maturase [Acidimicrobiales bacterium]
MTSRGATTPDELRRGWRLHPAVSVRPESFGAMTYHFGTRRLSFLKSPRLTAVVGTLADHPTALDACRAAGVPDGQLPAYVDAIRRLADTGVLVPQDGVPASFPASFPATLGEPGTGAAGGAAVGGAVAGGAAGGPATARPGAPGAVPLVERFQSGLASPICLTWELTYACNLACVHCLSSSGRRDPRELTAEECRAVVDELERMQVFYVNIGGGEPTIRRDFWDLLDYATAHHVGVKFSTNGTRITPAIADRLAANDYVDVQISLDGATAAVNDAVRGPGSYAAARRAMTYLSEAGFSGFKVSVVATRHNLDQLDRFLAIADEHGAQLRITRLRPSGRGADAWDDLHPTQDQQRALYDWLLAHGDRVLTGDSFFHLAGYGQSLPGLNLCGAGRVVCLIDPVGDVYACPFTIHDDFKAGNVRDAGGFAGVWATSPLFGRLRGAQPGGACTACSAYGTCRGGCMAAKYFTGLPLDGPDPECVKGHGAAALAAVDRAAAPRPSADHSRVPVALGPTRACDPSPLAGLRLFGPGPAGAGLTGARLAGTGPEQAG